MKSVMGFHGDMVMMVCMVTKLHSDVMNCTCVFILNDYLQLLIANSVHSLLRLSFIET